jgi:hypothetical protein
MLADDAFRKTAHCCWLAVTLTAAVELALAAEPITAGYGFQMMVCTMC